MHKGFPFAEPNDWFLYIVSYSIPLGLFLAGARMNEPLLSAPTTRLASPIPVLVMVQKPRDRAGAWDANDEEATH